MTLFKSTWHVHINKERGGGSAVWAARYTKSDAPSFPRRPPFLPACSASASPRGWLDRGASRAVSLSSSERVGRRRVAPADSRARAAAAFSALARFALRARHTKNRQQTMMSANAPPPTPAPMAATLVLFDDAGGGGGANCTPPPGDTGGDDSVTMAMFDSVSGTPPRAVDSAADSPPPPCDDSTCEKAAAWDASDTAMPKLML